MTINSKNLYTGQLANSLTDILAPLGVTQRIGCITIHNTSASLTETVVLAVQKSSTDYTRFEQELGPKESFDFRDSIYLESGMKLRGSTTTASTVNIVISGHEITS